MLLFLQFGIVGSIHDISLATCYMGCDIGHQLFYFFVVDSLSEFQRTRQFMKCICLYGNAKKQLH